MNLKNSIIINTSLINPSIGYVDGNEKLHIFEFENENQIDCKIVIAYEKMLTHFKNLTVDNIITSNGPGYFTGMRVGACFANALNLCYVGSKIYAYSNFDVVEKLNPKCNEMDTAILIDTKSKDIYKKQTKTLCENLVLIDDLNENKNYIVCGGEKFLQKFETYNNCEIFNFDIKKIYEFCRNEKIENLDNGVNLNYIKNATNQNIK